MSFPNHSEKYSADALICPDDYTGFPGRRFDGGAPEGLLVCYDENLITDIGEFYELTPVDSPSGDLSLFDDSPVDVGIVGGFGLGAPATAMLLEEFIAAGTSSVIVVGFAGCLDTDVNPQDVIVCDTAIRDEGTSHHYLSPGRTVDANPELVRTIESTLENSSKQYHTGASWTHDAFYRQTAAEIEEYTRSNVLSVEMEAAAAFAVAARRGVEAAAAFAVSDYVTPSEWLPRRRGARRDIVEVAAVAKRVLERRIAERR